MSGGGTVTLKIDHSFNMVDDIAALFKTKQFSDITLIVGGSYFLAHRVILASRCEYFRALLFGGLAETHSSTIRLNNISSTAFNHVLEYIYTGKLHISGLAVCAIFKSYCLLLCVNPTISYPRLRMLLIFSDWFASTISLFFRMIYLCISYVL